MTEEQAKEVAGRIAANETRLISELSDAEIMGYLIDASFEDTVENVKAVRSV